MLTNRLLRRTARILRRGGFTLVELLVVIGIIAILAGVALGPITNGIKQAKHNASLQTGRQIGQVCFSYATDNTANGNTYPADAKAFNIANDLISASYVSDPSVFLVSGQPNISASTGASVLTASNVSWSFTCLALNTTGGITSSASDLVPLVFFNNGPATALISSFVPSGGSAALPLSTACAFGTDGISIFYKGNNAVYTKALGGTIPANSFISSTCQDTATYNVAP